jgi:hypothetical protein
MINSAYTYQGKCFDIAFLLVAFVSVRFGLPTLHAPPWHKELFKAALATSVLSETEIRACIYDAAYVVSFDAARNSAYDDLESKRFLIVKFPAKSS